jgi:hypothetical protein
VSRIQGLGHAEREDAARKLHLCDPGSRCLDLLALEAVPSGQIRWDEAVTSSYSVISFSTPDPSHNRIVVSLNESMKDQWCETRVYSLRVYGFAHRTATRKRFFFVGTYWYEGMVM